METVIKNLIYLQDCDFRVKDLRTKQAEGPARIKALEEDLELAEAQADEEQSRVESIKRERRELEQGIQDLL